MTLHDKVCSIVAAVLKIDSECIDLDSGLGETPNWDSLNHTNLVLQLEESFDVGFDFDELDKITSIKAIISSLEEKGIKV